MERTQHKPTMSHTFAIIIYDPCPKCEAPLNPYHEKNGCSIETKKVKKVKKVKPVLRIVETLKPVKHAPDGLGNCGCYCDNCKSYKTEGKWVGCGECDTEYCRGCEVKRMEYDEAKYIWWKSQSVEITCRLCGDCGYKHDWNDDDDDMEFGTCGACEEDQ